MLHQLTIKNFALIDNLKVNFRDGFSIITGETGAGKSIILGGLGLILGKRANLSLLKKSDKKCIIEGEFDIEKYDLKPFFEDNDIDYDQLSILRREISPSGKSRAFVNDSPVNLKLLSELGEKLIDIHSQHQTLQLADTKFQFKIVDAFAENHKYLDSYKRGLFTYNQLNNELNELLRLQQEAKLQYDYNSFLVKELDEVNLKSDEQDFLEKTLEKLNNVEAIKQQFVEALEISNNEELGIKSILNTFKNHLSKLNSFSDDYQNLFNRTESISIEFDDIIDELEKKSDEISYSPQEIENYNDRLELIFNLQKKHNAISIDELLEIQQTLSIKIDTVENASEVLEAKKEELTKVSIQLNELANKIHNNRSKVIPKLVEQLEDILTNLSMPNTKFKIELSKIDSFLSNGKDEIQFLIASNKGSSFENLKKVASGGEMSRQ